MTLTGNPMLNAIKRLFLLAMFLCMSGCVSEEEEEFFDAAAFGPLARVQKLLPAVGDPDFHSIKGYTPLGAAAYNGHFGIVEFLIENGADVNFLDQDRVGPLYEAALGGHVEVMIYLLERGAILSEREKGFLMRLERLKNTQRSFQFLRVLES